MAIIATLVTLCQQTLLYFILTGWTELLAYYTLVIFFVLATGLAYSFTLVFSKASGRPWLQRVGFFLIPLSSALLVLVIISISSPDATLKANIQKAIEWIGLTVSISPCFILLNFLDELRNVNDEDTKTVFTQYATNLLGFLTIVGFALSLVFGLAIAGESSNVFTLAG